MYRKMEEVKYEEKERKAETWWGASSIRAEINDRLYFDLHFPHPHHQPTLYKIIIL